MTNSFAFKVLSTWTTHSDRVDQSMLEISLKPWWPLEGGTWIYSFFCLARFPLSIRAMMNGLGKWLKSWINKLGRYWGNFSMKHKCSLLKGSMFYSKYRPQLSISHAATFHGNKEVFDTEYRYKHIYIFNIFTFQLRLFYCNYPLW